MALRVEWLQFRDNANSPASRDNPFKLGGRVLISCIDFVLIT